MLLYHCLLTFGIVHVAVTISIKEIFHKHGIVPDVIWIAPPNLLNVTYNNDTELEPGAELTPFEVHKEPAIVWKPIDDCTHYTLIMTGPDAPSRTNHKYSEFVHWIVINIPGKDISQGMQVVGYIGAGPSEGSGFHRYVFLLFKQKSILINVSQIHIISNKSYSGRPGFNTKQFAETHRLGAPVAGNFFKAKYDNYVPIQRRLILERD